MTAPARPTCLRCGEAITPGARFCMKCGSDVSGEQGGVATAMMPAALEQDANDALLEVLKQATIGEYEIYKELGRGGMATVYLAHDIALDRKVAIKVMSPALLLMGEGMAERFKREARTAANLSHPNIIPIYTVKSAGKTLFFVMKFIAGRSLESIIHEIGPMPIPVAKAILQQVGNALGYAHRNGIVHRDVKPANIMIDEEGWSVVTDFGIAKVAENRGLTMTGIAVGTPSYMSPEQCAAKDITGKSDQYSLGVVAYEMLTGKQPFEGDSAMSIMFQHFHEQPKPLQEMRTDIPPAVVKAVMRMLEKAPEKRWGSMEEAMAALGAQPLAHDDPQHLNLIEVVRRGSNRDLLKGTTPPTSPVPPAKTRQVVDAATTPIPAARIVGLTIAPARSDIHVGDTLTLTATPRIAGGSNAGGTVAWSSSDPAIASVTDAGVVTAHLSGAVVITGTCEGIRGTAEIAVTNVPVASVLVEPIEPRVAEGGTLQLTVRLRDRNGAVAHDRLVRWSAAPPHLVDVTPTGLVTARREGVVEVIAESEGVSGSTRLRIDPPPVASLLITPTEGTVNVGETLTLAAQPLDAAGNRLERREITWQSSAQDVATVSNRGVVTGIADGMAKISAESEGKRAVATIKVEPAPVASVTIAPPKPLVAGERVTLEVTIKDARGRALTGRTVKWTSTSPGVAMVTQNGQLTGMSAGSARVTAECEGKSWTVTVTVQPVPVAVEPRADVVRPTEAEVATEVIQRPATPIPTPKPPPAPPPAPAAAPAPALSPATPIPTPKPVPAAAAAGPAEVAGHSEPEGAPAPGKGRMIGLLAGAAVVAGIAFIALRGGGGEPIPPAPAPPVIVTAAVQSVAVTGESGPVTVGRTLQLAALVKGPAGEELSNRTVTWTSSDASVAEVSAVGAVTTRKAGSTTITAASEGKSGSLTLVVIPPSATPEDLPAAVASVALAGPVNHSLDVGGTVQLEATLKDAKGGLLTDRTVVWTTSDPDVVLASSAGLVTAVGGGTARVFANSEGKSAEARFTVRAPKPPEPEPEPPKPVPVAVQSINLAPENPEITVGNTVQLTATALDAGRNALADRSVAWRTSDPGIARVDEQGEVTGASKGSATITATVEGKSASTRVTVTVATVPVASVVITAPSKNLKVGETTTWSAVAQDKGGKPLEDRTVSWSSGAPAVAVVNGAGVITAVSPGTAEIRAEAEGRRDNERITVTAAPAPPVTTPPVTTPAQPPPVSTAAGNLPRRGVEAGGVLSCGIAPSGAVCWGAGQSGLVAIEGTAGMTSLSVGRAHACGLLAGGRAVCWGANAVGQLGDGGTTTSTSAVDVGGGLSFSSITVGAQHSCGLVGGKAYCWGRGKDGQLGDGGSSDRRRPVAVKGGNSYSLISAGGNHTCAITAAGKAFCWGDGFSGQLGFGAMESQFEPIDVRGQLKFSRIAAGGKHSCGITTGGKAYCWGANESGQLGDGSKNDRSEPEAVSTTVTFSEIALGGTHSCAIGTGGDLYCWGDNKSGQLGDGGKASRDKPTAVTGGLDFASVSAGEAHTCGVTRGGEALCWGRNEKGQLGDGGTAARGSPAPVRNQR